MAIEVVVSTCCSFPVKIKIVKIKMMIKKKKNEKRQRTILLAETTTK